MPRYDNRVRRAERAPYHGDQPQEAGSLDAGDADEQPRQVQPARGRGGGVRARTYRGGGKGGDGRGQVHRGRTKEGYRGNGRSRSNPNLRGQRKDSFRGYKNYQGRDGSYQDGRGNGGNNARSGSWKGPYKNFNYATRNGQGNIPVITTTTTNAADTGNNGWNEWGNSGNHEHWDDAADGYQYNDGYQQDHDDQDQSWGVDQSSHYDPTSRKPYQREMDEGGKRKSQTKATGKDSKKAKVEVESKK